MSVPEAHPIGDTSHASDTIHRQFDTGETEDEMSVQRKSLPSFGGVLSGSQDHVRSVIGSDGQSLDPRTRSFFEPRLGYDLSSIRIHAAGQAAESARALNARAYTLGNDIVFGSGEYKPESENGKHLLAHELAHVVQQSGSAAIPSIQRQCVTGTVCTQPICGDPGVFNSSESSAEAAGRNARQQQAQQNPAAVVATGHGRRATNLEAIATANGLNLSAIQGIFVDLDMSSGTGAYTHLCGNFIGFVPPFAGPAGAECIFVPDSDEAEAGIANATPLPRTVGGIPRRQWLQGALQILTHELQHVRFDRASHLAIGGSSCSRATVMFTASNGEKYDVEFYLSELSAILSEFTVVFDSVRRRTPSGEYGQLLENLSRDYRDEILNCDESIIGVLTALRCRCPCSAVNAFVRDTVTFTSAAWAAPTAAVFDDFIRSRFPMLNWPAP